MAVHQRRRGAGGPGGLHRNAQRRGTYEADVTVTRTGPQEFLVVSSAATTERDQDHIRRNMPARARAEVVDVTSSMAVLG